MNRLRNGAAALAAAAVASCAMAAERFDPCSLLKAREPRPGEAVGPLDYWKQIFARPLERRKESGQREEGPNGRGMEKGAERPLRVRGVGDEAYWVGPAVGGGLYVLEDDVYFRLSVGGPDTEAVKIEKLKKLARYAVRRLPVGERIPRAP